jgi:hypothetical protein
LASREFTQELKVALLALLIRLGSKKNRTNSRLEPVIKPPPVVEPASVEVVEAAATAATAAPVDEVAAIC